jgi:hypothetical protein
MDSLRKGMLPAINITINVTSNDMAEAMHKKPVDKEKLTKVNEEMLKMMKKEKEPVFVNKDLKADKFIK